MQKQSYLSDGGGEKNDYDLMKSKNICSQKTFGESPMLPWRYGLNGCDATATAMPSERLKPQCRVSDCENGWASLEALERAQP